jgi:LmbE family N-acetylglucosaminyl deacetylase
VLTSSLRDARKLLFLGAHSDDIEIGCGGTVLSLLESNPNRDILWVVFSAKGKRRQEAQVSAQQFLKRTTRSKVIIKAFRESYFPNEYARMKDWVETLKQFEPDAVFTHYRNDRHQDHRVLSDLAWNTFRRHLILEYEIPKYDGDLGQPNFFVPLESRIAQQKAKTLCASFPSQTARHWFSGGTFLGLMRLRGVECTSRFAEGFFCRKIVCTT